MVRITGMILIAALLAVAGCSRPAPPPQSAPIFAKNVILFIGDGMGVTTVTAARIFDGQSKGLAGEEHELAFERFPHVALVKTYSTNQQVSDSAGTVTAMLTGHKTRAGVINVPPGVQRRDCAAALDNRLTSLGSIAKQRGLTVGFVTTARVTHATPAGLYAHTPERDWEVDTLTPRPDWDAGCRDVAWQLVNSEIDVAMGGASKYFFGSNRGGARRNADEDLVRQWLGEGAKRRYIASAEQLETLKPGDEVLGLFAQSHMTYVAEREDDTTEPTLSQMTAAAIDVMAGNDDGYFLMVEGGRIDHGHHAGKPGYALLETQEFNRAVEVARQHFDIGNGRSLARIHDGRLRDARQSDSGLRRQERRPRRASWRARPRGGRSAVHDAGVRQRPGRRHRDAEAKTRDGYRYGRAVTCADEQAQHRRHRV